MRPRCLLETLKLAGMAANPSFSQSRRLAPDVWNNSCCTLPLTLSSLLISRNYYSVQNVMQVQSQSLLWVVHMLLHCLRLIQLIVHSVVLHRTNGLSVYSL